MDLNLHQIRGRLGDDPDVRFTQSNTAVANLSIATSHRYKSGDEWKEETTWHKVILWGRLAEIAQEYLSKGDLVYVQGRVQTNVWEDNDGNKRYTKETVGQKLHMLGGGNGDGNNSNRGGGQGQAARDNNPDDGIDDDLPF